MKYYLCITPFFPTKESFRGPFIYDQVKAIERNSEYKVVVFKPYSFRFKEDDYEFEGIKVYRFTDYTLPSNILPNSISNRLTYRSFLKKIRDLGIKPEEVAVIHSHTIDTANIAAWLKRDYPDVYSIIQHHGFDVAAETNGILSKYSWHKKICRKYASQLCNTVDLNIGVSNKTLEYVKELPDINLKDSYVLYNGVDTTKFYPKNKKNKSDEFIIGCVGNFWELKDQMTLIRALEEIIKNSSNNLEGKEIKVKFIGTGPTRKGCEEYIEEKGIQRYFEFIDSLPHNKLPYFYRGLDLFVLPSYSEAFGCVYTEAYACGVPFMGVKDQGISEIIPYSEKDYWLIEKEDYNNLANLIIRFSNISKSQSLSVSFSIDDLISSFINFIQQR